jgi:hypothetical protein
VSTRPAPTPESGLVLAGATRCGRCHLLEPHVCLHSDAWPLLTMADDDAAPEDYVAGPVDREPREAAAAAAEVIDSESENAAIDAIVAGATASVVCGSCGARGWFAGQWRHRPDCGLDRTLTATQRYLRRNPWRMKRRFRILQIKSRWAVINGMCAVCLDQPSRLGFTRCEECAAAENDRQRKRRERQQAETPQMEAA